MICTFNEFMMIENTQHKKNKKKRALSTKAPQYTQEYQHPVEGKAGSGVRLLPGSRWLEWTAAWGGSPVTC